MRRARDARSGRVPESAPPGHRPRGGTELDHSGIARGFIGPHPPDAPISARDPEAHGAGQGREAPSCVREALTRAVAPAECLVGAAGGSRDQLFACSRIGL